MIVVNAYLNAAPGWLPSSLASLEAWYDADAQGGSDGSNLNPWPDRSGNGWSATTGGSGPTLEHGELNGLKVVRFTTSLGSGLSMSSSLMNGATAGCFFAVFKIDSDPPAGSSSSGAVLDSFTNDATGSTMSSHHPWHADGVFYEHFGTSVRKTVGNPTPSFSSSYRIYSVHSASADYRAYVDGTSIFSAGTNTVNFGSKSRCLGWTAGSGGALSVVGHVAEVVIFDSALVTGDRQKVEGYLAHKWGLTGSLDGAHPYKSTPPT